MSERNTELYFPCGRQSSFSLTRSVDRPLMIIQKVYEVNHCWLKVEPSCKEMESVNSVNGRWHRGAATPVLKIRSHGSHGRGTKGMLLYLLVPPRSLFCPSNSVYSPPQTIVLSPQIPNHLSSPQNNCSVPSNSVSSRSQNHSVPSKVNCPPKLPVMFREKWGKLTLCIYLPQNSE